MYHIPNDKRAQRSAEALCMGLLDCLEHKRYTDVTVRDLSMASGVSRATFYRLFDNISDILTWKCECLLQQALKQAKLQLSLPAVLEGFVQSWMDNKLLMDALIRCNRTEILYEVHGKYTEEMKDIFLPDITVNRIQSEYLSALLAAILPAAFRVWIKYPEEPLEMVDRFRESLKLLDKMFQFD